MTILLSRISNRGSTQTVGTSFIGGNCGYAMMANASLIAGQGFGSIFIHPDHFLNNHPFYSLSAYNASGFSNCPESMDNEIKKNDDHASLFIVDDSPNLGFQSITSTKQIEGSKDLKITSIALCKRGDKSKSYTDTLEFCIRTHVAGNFEIHTSSQGCPIHVT